MLKTSSMISQQQTLQLTKKAQALRPRTGEVASVKREGGMSIPPRPHCKPRQTDSVKEVFCFLKEMPSCMLQKPPFSPSVSCCKKHVYLRILAGSSSRSFPPT